jgi:LPXTG-site transpeptidase (sortase) family protein
MAAGLVASGGTMVIKQYYDTHHAVHNTVDSLPDDQIPNILASQAPPVPSLSPTSIIPSPEATPTPEVPKIPEVAPHVPERIIIPKLSIDAQIDAIEDPPIKEGVVNSWGGPVYDTIHFPVDNDARYWGKQGMPNSLPNANVDVDPQAVLNTVIYGHASDRSGGHLLFQDLEQLDKGDTFSLVAGEYEFTYMVFSTSNPAKDGLADDSEVYNLPADGRKQVALVACLPNSASHSVRIGVLTDVRKI